MRPAKADAEKAAAAKKAEQDAQKKAEAKQLHRQQSKILKENLSSRNIQ